MSDVDNKAVVLVWIHPQQILQHSLLVGSQCRKWSQGAAVWDGGVTLPWNIHQDSEINIDTLLLIPCTFKQMLSNLGALVRVGKLEPRALPSWLLLWAKEIYPREGFEKLIRCVSELMFGTGGSCAPTVLGGPVGVPSLCFWVVHPGELRYRSPVSCQKSPKAGIQRSLVCPETRPRLSHPRETG